MSAHKDSVPLKIGDKKVAVLRGTLLDVRRTADGLLTTPPGIALACDLLNEAEARGCTDIQVTVDGQTKYFITLQDFKANSFPIHRGNYEPQRACVMSAFNAEYKTKLGGAKSMKALEKMRRPAPQQQMSLWGANGI